MSKEVNINTADKKEMYDLLRDQITALVKDDKFFISSLSNISSVLMDTLHDINWVGFYLRKGDTLYLGPFQGKLACVEIKMGKGVCGTAAAEGQTKRIADVHTFAGHIACDCNTNAEIVIPIHENGEVIAVLDIDSTTFERFDETDQAGLEQLAVVIENNIKPLFV